MKKKTKKMLYKLGIYLVLFPILGYISYVLYYNFVFINMTTGLLKYMILFLIIGINLLALYGVNHLNKFVSKSEFIKFGFIVNLVIIVFNILYIVLENQQCVANTFKCEKMMSYGQTLKIILILSIAYTLIYLIMYSITNTDKKHASFDGKLVK